MLMYVNTYSVAPNSVITGRFTYHNASKHWLVSPTAIEMNGQNIQQIAIIIGLWFTTLDTVRTLF